MRWNVVPAYSPASACARNLPTFAGATSPYDVGELPLPPYIRRPSAEAGDAERYQTVFAREPGSVAAPTAGLHLSEPLLRALGERGVERAELVLHVGPGTFRPVTAQHLRERRRVANAEVEALAGDRVNRMGRVAGQREARRGVVMGDGELQGIGPPLPLKRQGAEKVAEAALQLREVKVVRQRMDAFRLLAPFGPDQGRTVSG